MTRTSLNGHVITTVGAASFPVLDDARGPSAVSMHGRIIPLRPLWPGFAINTLFYAAILWALFAAPAALRRKRRIKRGRCPACGYPIGANDVCTECGRAVTPRQRVYASQAVLPPGRAGG